MRLSSPAGIAVDLIQVAFRRVALSYTKDVLIYKAGRSNKDTGVLRQFFERHRRRSEMRRGEGSWPIVADGDFSELGWGHIDMLFERAVKCRL